MRYDLYVIHYLVDILIEIPFSISYPNLSFDMITELAVYSLTPSFMPLIVETDTMGFLRTKHKTIRQ